MQFLAITVIISLIGGGMHQTQAAAIVMVNGKVVVNFDDGALLLSFVCFDIRIALDVCNRKLIIECVFFFKR